MRLGLTCIGIILTTFNFCWAQYDSTYIFKDFNEDGFTDTLLTYYDGGSGYGGTFVEIRNGANDDLYAMNSDGCFCQIRQTFVIPKNLTQLKNAPFLTAITSQLLPPFRSGPDPSLRWMLAAELNNHQLEDSLFIQIVNPQQEWLTGEIEIPGNYYIEMKGDLLGLYRHEHAASGSSELMNKAGYMTYYARNHYANKKDTLELSAENKTYQIFKTKHGVIAKKGDTYKWLFVSDVFVTWAPEKLRWASIGKMRLVGKYLLFEQHLPPNLYSPTHVINIETGKFGRFTWLIDENHDPFSEENNSIQFILEDEMVKYTFQAIFTALDAN
jgi:hypothetical protein